MVNEEDYILVEMYLDGVLSSEKKNAFLKRVSSDETLKKILIQAELQNDWIKQSDLRKKTQEDFNEIKNQVKIKKNPFWKLAAVILFILFLLSGLFWYFSPEKKEIIHRPLATKMGTNQTTSVLFNKGDYITALPLIEQHLEKEKDTDWLIALGICHLELKQWQKAIQIFQDLEKTAPVAYNDAIIFYQGITYYRSNSKEQAEIILKKVSSSSYYYSFAQEILEKK